MSRLLHVLIQLMLAAGVLCGAELSVSMRLECRMAVRRGVKAMVAWQGPDGSWGGDVSVTSQCLLALAMTGLQGDFAVFAPCRNSGMDYLRRRMADPLSPAERSGALRALLRNGDAVEAGMLATQELKTEVISKLARQWQSMAPKGEASADDSFEITATDRADVALQMLELFGLLGAAPPPSESLNRLKERLLAAAPPYAFALRSMMGQRGGTLSLEDDCPDMPSLYWGVRGLLGVEAPGHWRDSAVSMLLDGQKSDGAWGGKSQGILERACMTALAIQIIALCN